jgi:hypothetical protein
MAESSLATLHRDAARHAHFSKNRASPPYFDRAIQSWVVSDPRDAKSLLTTPHLRVVAFGDAYGELERRTAHSFPNLLFAFRHVPLCLNGSDHRDARRRIADFLSRRRAGFAAAVPGMVDRHFAVLDRQSDVDLMDDVLNPLVAEFIGALTETKITDGGSIRRASLIFDRMLGLKKRLQLEEEIGSIRAMIRQSPGADLSEEDEGLRLALFVLGHDALLGTLGENLYQILKANSKRRLDEIAFPAIPVETGVPYVERVVAEPFEHAGIAFSRGERIRVLMQGLVYSAEAEDRARMFGVGLHACLGRQMSLDIWARITAKLSKTRRTVEILSYAMRTGDYVFTCPSLLLIRVST